MSDTPLPGRAPDVDLSDAAQPDGPLRIRLVTEDEWESYRDLRRQMLADSPDYFWATLADVADYTEATWRQRAAGPQTHLQALAEGEVVGTLSIDWIGYTEDMLLDEDTVNIVSVFVRPGQRGRGVVEALLGAADEVMRGVGRSRQLLETPEDNVRGRRAYERLGFTETGHRCADPRRPHLQEIEYGRTVPPR